MSANHKLTPRQERFVQEYLIDMVGTKAAIRAGYPASNAGNTSAGLMKEPAVMEAIAKAQAERSARIGLHQDRVLQWLSTVAFAKITDFVEWDANGVRILPSADIEDSTPIVTVKQRKTRVTNSRTGEITETIEQDVSLADKHKAIERLGNHMGMFKVKVEHSLDMRRKVEREAKKLGLDPDAVWQTALELADSGDDDE